ncbi:MAG: hypothetical protein JWP63_4025, partial [Candidatus Solibacter sp.]|nr:hypothetical protein [Candidatus Solibacter sp.]
ICRPRHRSSSSFSAGHVGRHPVFLNDAGIEQLFDTAGGHDLHIPLAAPEIELAVRAGRGARVGVCVNEGAECAPRRCELLLGYGAMSEREIAAGVRLLEGAIVGSRG